MVFLLLSIVLLIFVILVALLPPFYCWLAYFIILGLLGIVFLINLVFILNHRGKKKIEIVSIILLVLIDLSSFKLFSITHNYHEVVKGLNKDFPNQYKILKLSDYKVNQRYVTCDYLFDVKLKDKSNVIFHYGYCDMGVMWTSFNTYNDYAYYYIPYYIEKYNKTNHTDIKYDYKSNDDLIIINYSDNNNKDVKSFIDYLFSITGDKKYQFILKNNNSDKQVIVSSWNDDYILDLDY